MVEGGVNVISLNSESYAERNYYLITYDFKYADLNLRSTSCATIHDNKLYCIVHTDLSLSDEKATKIILKEVMESFEVIKPIMQ